MNYQYSYLSTTSTSFSGSKSLRHCFQIFLYIVSCKAYTIVSPFYVINICNLWEYKRYLLSYNLRLNWNKKTDFHAKPVTTSGIYSTIFALYCYLSNVSCQMPCVVIVLTHWTNNIALFNKINPPPRAVKLTTSRDSYILWKTISGLKHDVSIK